jgi:hypothetical protein
MVRGSFDLQRREQGPRRLETDASRRGSSSASRPRRRVSPIEEDAVGGAGWLSYPRTSPGLPREGEPPMTSEEVLRRLTIGDPAYCRTVMAADPDDPPQTLDARSLAFLRLGASIRASTPGPMWQQGIDGALAAGLSFDEIVASLTALAPTVGIERVVAIAPDMARALGYDVDAALESPEGDQARGAR